VDMQLSEALSLPTVAVPGHKNFPGVTNIVLDHQHAARAALQHLLALGHKDIAFLKGQPFSSDSEYRWGAICRVAEELKIEIKPELTVQIDPRLYGASDETILERLRAVSEDVPSVMVIGHNPGVQDLALSLARGGPALEAVQEGFATGALATLELPVESWRAVAPGSADVVGFVTPRALA